MYALSSGLLFAYSKLISANGSNRKEYLLLGLSLLVPYLIDPGVMFNGALWITGSMNYFWIATLGLFGFYPILYYVIRQRPPSSTITVLGFICGSMAACSQEQVGLVLVTFTGIFVAYQLYKYFRNELIKFPAYTLVLLLFFVAFFLFSVLAPGNSIRDQAETMNWLPDFHSATLLQHINYGYRWLLDGLLNNGGFLLVSAWALLVALFTKKRHKDKWDLSIMLLLTIMTLFTLTKGYEGISYWFNFYATWKPSLPNKIASLSFIPWTVILLTTVAAPLVLYRKSNKKGIVLSLLFSAAIASTAVITLSPTMYASGVRTLYVPSVILALTILVLSVEVLDKYKKIWYLVIVSILAVATSEYFLLLLMIVNKTP
jgi:hypothetical protein